MGNPKRSSDKNQNISEVIFNQLNSSGSNSAATEQAIVNCSSATFRVSNQPIIMHGIGQFVLFSFYYLNNVLAFCGPSAVCRRFG